MPGCTIHLEFLRQLKNLLNLFRVVVFQVQALLPVKHVSETLAIFWQQTPLIGSIGPRAWPNEQKSKPLLIQFRQLPNRSERKELRDRVEVKYEIKKRRREVPFIFNYIISLNINQIYW
jgi:hypothetical protein